MFSNSIRLQYVAHRIQSRGLVDQPARGVQRASGEDRAVTGLVRQFQTLAVAQKQHGVFACHVTTPNRLVADFSAFAATLGVMPCHLVMIEAAGFRDRGAEFQRGTRRCIDLPAVMNFGNLGIECGRQTGRRATDQVEQQVDAEREISGLTDGSTNLRISRPILPLAPLTRIFTNQFPQLSRVCRINTMAPQTRGREQRGAKNGKVVADGGKPSAAGRT